MSQTLNSNGQRKRKLSYSYSLPTKINTVPWIREATLGQNLGIRAKAISEQNILSIGPSDLVHWSRQHGERSSRYIKNDFSPISESDPPRDQDGFVGFFHFCNGLDLAAGTDSIEQQVLESIGLRKNGNSYVWAPKEELAKRLGLAQNREGVVTFCAYNCFQKLEFCARFIVTPSAKPNLGVVVNSQYTITSKLNKKLHTFIGENCRDISQVFLEELAVLLLLRMFLGVDDPAHRLLGTVSHKTQIEQKEEYLNTIDRLVSFLSRGHLTGMRAKYGVGSSSGTDSAKTTRYRNRLVDTLVRLVLLDASGAAADFALDKIRTRFGAGEFTAVEVRILRAQHSGNNNQRFLTLVRDHMRYDSSSTQSAVLVGEQVKFLISKGSYAMARKLAIKGVSMLPLDFDSWYNLCVCYILEKRYDDALQTINSLPVLLHSRRLYEGDSVDGIKDTYVLTFMDRLANGHIPIMSETFVDFFPSPQNADLEAGSVQSIWHGMFRKESARHPMLGPFYQSPLTTASPIEMSAIDSGIVKIAGPSSTKNILAARSSSAPWSSILDFDRKSTWGRVYDLLTALVAVIGWENLLAIKLKVFRSSLDRNREKEYVVSEKSSAQKEECALWLEQLFLVMYDDILVMTTVSGGSDPDRHRSAMAWGMMGLVSWGCKYNLKDSISSLATCAAGIAADGGFDYYSTVKLLEIYHEFVLSDVDSSAIDQLTCVYDDHSYTNKLIVLSISPKMYRDFVNQLVNGYMAFETMLVHLMKLIAWELRWYCYVPSQLVVNTLISLCHQRDPLEVRASFKIAFEKYKRQAVNSKLSKNFFQSWFGGHKLEVHQEHDFVDGDTIVHYIDSLLLWLELLN